MIKRCLGYAAAAVLACGSCFAEDVKLYVAPGGSDMNSGTAEQPLASVQAALDKAAALAPAAVILKDGTYRITEPLFFKEKHSGVALKAEHEGKAVISGGRKITGWQEGSGGLWSAKVPDLPGFNQLFINGERKIRARTPNSGWYTGKPYNQSQVKNLDYKENFDCFRFKPGQFVKIKPGELTNVYVTVFHAWTTSLHALEGLDMTQKVAFVASPPFKFPIGKWEVRFVIENYRAALDAPGEWYLDAATQTVYYMPKAGETITEAVAPAVSKLLLLDGTKSEPVKNVTVEGIVFEHCDWTLPRNQSADGQLCRSMSSAAFAAVSGNYVQDSVLKNCIIRRIGADAVWLEAGCRNVLIKKNHLYDVGASALKAGTITYPVPVPASDLTERIKIDNNLIHDCGIVFHGGCGIGILDSPNNTVSHNEISDLDYTGISVGWGWGTDPSSAKNNLVEYNRISHIGRKVMSDMAGIYLPNKQPGTVVRNNIIHDINSYEYGGNGIYADALGCDMLFESNLVYRVSSAGFMRNKGWDNTVQNNIFAFCRQGFYWSGLSGTNTPSGHINSVLERNISYCNGTNTLYRKNGREVDFKTVFPVKWNSNLYWNEPTNIMFGAYTFEQWQKNSKQDRHSQVADPLFVNPLANDFTLQAGSPAFEMGFKAIDYSQVGLYGDPDWIALPKTLDHSFISEVSSKEPSDQNGM